MIPFADLGTPYRLHKAEIDGAIARVLEHGKFIMGPEVFEMERELAAYTGVEHCVSVASGTEAMLIALMALGIGPGDEVITPAFTFAATAEVVLLAGATPVLVDIESHTCNINAELLERAITPRTRAIIPVSLYGQPADMDAINAIADARGLVVIEDAAQSFGAKFQGSMSCALSRVGCTSFFPSKPLGCYGDGGAIFSNDEDFVQACREIRVHGQSARYHHTRVGVGGRMDTLQCAIVLAKLKYFGWETTRRIEIGQRYNRMFADAGVDRVFQKQDRTSVFAQYTVFVEDRTAVQRELDAAGIPTAVHYPKPLNEQPAYRDRSIYGDLPHSRSAAERVLSLPMHPYLEESAQDYIVAEVAKAVAK